MTPANEEPAASPLGESSHPELCFQATLAEWRHYRDHEVMHFDRHAVAAALFCGLAFVLGRLVDEVSGGLLGILGVLWLWRSILSLWEKLEIAQLAAAETKLIASARSVFRHDLGQLTWRVRTVFDVLFFGSATLLGLAAFALMFL